ncbi:MAG: 2-polyprenyl-6-methoxyphenol hydroxylase-like FAD-dependent oxidoreductase [Bacillariaceae sp.]
MIRINTNHNTPDWISDILDATSTASTTRQKTPTMTTSANNSGSGEDDSHKNDVTAIVIGCGPAGLACGLALSNVCRKVILVEKHSTFDQRGSTFGMGLNGQKTLDELRPGLRQHMEDTGIPTSPGGTIMFVWWEMRDVFLHHVKETPNIDLYCGEEFIDITQTQSIVTVTFKSGMELKGNFLVGADGVHSNVRNVLKLPPILKSDITNYRGNFLVPETASTELQALLEKGIVPLYTGNGKELYFIVFNFHSRHTGRLAWLLATNLHVADDDDVEKNNNDNDTTSTSTCITPYSIIKDNVKDVGQRKIIEEIFNLSADHQLQPYPQNSIIDLNVKNKQHSNGDGDDRGWGGKGLITLVGDAAHGMRATDGYGGSMAFEDAVVLSRILKKKTRSDSNESSSLSELLNFFEIERYPRVKRVYDNQYERYELRMSGGKRLDPQSKEFLEWLLAGV